MQVLARKKKLGDKVAWQSIVIFYDGSTTIFDEGRLRGLVDFPISHILSIEKTESQLGAKSEGKQKKKKKQKTSFWFIILRWLKICTTPPHLTTPSVKKQVQGYGNKNYQTQLVFCSGFFVASPSITLRIIVWSLDPPKETGEIPALEIPDDEKADTPPKC